jgi:hypothetical protein
MSPKTEKDWASYFSAMNDHDLNSAWCTWGRAPCEEELPERDAPAFLAVNQELYDRGLPPYDCPTDDPAATRGRGYT